MRHVDFETAFEGFLDSIGGEYVQVPNQVTGMEGGQVRDYDGHFTKASVKRARQKFKLMFDSLHWLLVKIPEAEMSDFRIGQNIHLQSTGSGSGFWDENLSRELIQDFNRSFEVMKSEVYVYPSQKKSYLVLEII